jgi:hypothetical protein
MWILPKRQQFDIAALASAHALPAAATQLDPMPGSSWRTQIIYDAFEK